MPTGNLKLTSLDKKILHSYCQTLDGLSNYLGNGYEIVLHSLEDYEHSAIKVINGYHTGRTEGAPITDLALKMLEQIRRNEENDHGVIYYLTIYYLQLILLGSFAFSKIQVSVYIS